MTDRRTRLRLLAGVLAFGLVAAACGSGSDSGDGDGGGGDGGNGGGDVGSTDITTEAGEPKDGGKVVFGLEAESSGFDPVSDRWAISAYQVATAIYDPIVAYDENNDLKPYLAESVTPNDDATEWTITLREGVTFHDGAPLTAEDAIFMYQQHIASPLTKPVFAPVTSVEPVEGDPLSFKFVLDQSWYTFPVTLSAQTGYVASRATIEDEGGGLKPVGTGPFELKSYEPDSAFIATKYDGYWQEGLPHLDEIEYRPIADVNSRQAAFDAGDIQIFTTDNFEVKNDYSEKCAAGDCQIIIDPGESEEVLVILNTATAPFNNENARKALAYATDKQAIIDTVAPGAVPANGPWAPNSPWYDPVVEETYLQYDPEKAREAVAAYEEETGETLSFEFGSTPSPSVREAVDLLAAQWAEVGIETDVKIAEQTAYILGAVNGSFQANIWRQFSSSEPDGDYIWWISDNAAEPGTIGLNMARNKDPQIDEALEAARVTTEEEERKASYATVAERLATDIPYVWIYHTNYGLIAANDVHGITNGPLPDGSPSKPMQGGVARVTYLWIE